MGYLAHGTCHASQNDALEAACAKYPQSVLDGSVLRSVSCTGTDATSLLLERSDDGVSVGTLTLTPTFPTCDELRAYTDTGEVFLLCLGALAVIWFARFVYMTLIGHPQ